MEYWLFLMVFATSNASGPVSLGPFDNKVLCEQAGRAVVAEYSSARLVFPSEMGPKVKASCLPITRKAPPPSSPVDMNAVCAGATGELAAACQKVLGAGEGKK